MHAEFYVELGQSEHVAFTVFGTRAGQRFKYLQHTLVGNSK